jgi:RluA family pseudouridine synthase
VVDLQLNPPKTYPFRLKVLYEDEHLAVVYKPSGLPVSGNRYKTVLHALPFNLQPSHEPDALKWPKPVHRLDVPTQKLLMVAKTAGSLMQMGKQLQERCVRKRYRAVVAGKSGSGRVDTPVDHKEAITTFQTIRSTRSLKTGHLSLVDLFPLTGRKHQLRVHMAGLGHPIIGDQTHTSGFPLLKGKGLFLSAVELDFVHPVDETTIRVMVDQPAKFDTLLEREAARWKKYKG